MIPYKEAKETSEVFDWAEFLTKDQYTREELADASDKAKSWVTCACGNLCDAIPRCITGEPKDYRLHNLGMNFSSYIASMSMRFWIGGKSDLFDAAKRDAWKTLMTIEKRSAEILNEMNQN